MSNKTNKQVSLLDKAKSIKRPQQSSDASDEDQIALSIAYMTREITLTQLGKAVWPAMNQNSLSAKVYGFVATGLIKAYEAGRITIADKNTSSI